MTAPFTDAPLNTAEQAVLDRIRTDGLHVVHFWAPWCPNARRELERGLLTTARHRTDVHITFVTVWNEGQSGRETLDALGVPDSVVEVCPTGDGTREDRENRRRHFLGLPMTWIPTTWLFHQHGRLAYAFNHGELEASDLERALAWLEQDWTPDESMDRPTGETL